MILKKIKLLNFRNYNKIIVTLSPTINIFIGNNAQGKTNILESIYVLGLTKSYRTTSDYNLIKFEKENFKIQGELKIEKAYRNMSIDLTNDKKTVKVNNNEIKKISDYITNLNVILVSPEDIEIIKGSPADRRNFLNIELSQLSKSYIKKYNEFSKILKIRNDYLKLLYKNSNSDTRYLDSLTENLIEREISIYKERHNFISKINKKINRIYKDISGIEGLNIIYENNIEFKSFEEDRIEESLREKYAKSLRKEIENGMTLYGPHRDELKFYINNEDIKIFGSWGQQKLAIIALKLAEIEIFEEVTKTKPIVLLDDIFSELDRKNRNKVTSYINKDFQVVITSNDTRGINKKLLDNAKIFEVSNGEIIEKGGENNDRR